MYFSVDVTDDVALITWDDGENRVNLDSLAALHGVLDDLVATSGPLAFVLTGVGKFFSNGLDLARFGDRPEEITATLEELHRTVCRLLTFPAYGVAALNGHTFAAGALLSCAFDHRVMRADRGYWCMNEADIGLPLDEKLAAILFNRLPRASAIEAMLTARRYAASEAQTAGIVEDVVAPAEVRERALSVAAMMASKDRRVLATHKKIAHRDVVTFLGHPEYL